MGKEEVFLIFLGASILLLLALLWRNAILRKTHEKAGNSEKLHLKIKIKGNRTGIIIVIALLILESIYGAVNWPEGIDYGLDGSKWEYVLADKGGPSPIFIDPNADPLIYWAAHELAADIEKTTGQKPDVTMVTEAVSEKGIYIGEFRHPLIESLKCSSVKSLEGKWEHFHIRKRGEQLIIAGSDIRGTVFGIFEVTERAGISPWQWWADVTPLPQERMSVNTVKSGISQGPSVKYRGIFINDEDWGMQPWAAKTFEPETGDIGPKTYEKIFQLLLRLKANTIWPAMHPCTQGFYQVPGNNEMAKIYHIVVGTSHCEPMLRNNVDEWDHERFGDFNYFTNEDMICDYWQSRILEVSDAENIITLGMRGVHDGNMEGGSNFEERRHMLEEIIKVQRSMLEETKNRSLDSIAQNIILYKEVLDYYNQGLEVPEDVTLMWCDDNYGYIRRLSNEEEQKRPGGSGVYYHLSYWGRPHDYLWLSSTQPGLIWYEMSRAFANGAKRSWIVNVGDLKPAEYNMEFFLDLAWDVESIDHKSIAKHMQDWASREFGNTLADEVCHLMQEHYRLAFIRKPEFMGWSQTEPTTAVRASGFNTQANGNEVERRIKMYRALYDQAEGLKHLVSKDRKAAWFQLIEYPVKTAALMNFKFLYAQLASKESKGAKSNEYEKLARQSYEEIKKLTEYYNINLSKGKWKHMMSMKPRNLPVYDFPASILENKNPQPEQEAHSTAQDRVFLQAKDYSHARGALGHRWISIEGLGYSSTAMSLYPFNNQYFDKDDLPHLEYVFETQKTGEFEIQVRCLPTHSNSFDHIIMVQIDDGDLDSFQLNTKGRSKQWKENVLRNHQVIKLRSSMEKTGKHRIRIYVNQTGIVLDQLAIDFTPDEPFYEIPIRNKK